MGNFLNPVYTSVPTNNDTNNIAIPMDCSDQNQFGTFKNKVIQNNHKELNEEPDEKFNCCDNDLKKPILLLACQDTGGFEKVDDKTLRLLIDKGAKIDYIDRDFYGWEAVHYAARAANPQKLKVLCDKLGKERINTLTTLSENALHIVLDHGRFAESFNISCQDGLDLKMCKIIGRERQCIVKCVEILLEWGIDANHSNFWNETPIIIANKRKYFEVVQLLLKVKHIDLDSCRGAVSGKTARELLKRQEANFGLLPKHAITNDPKKILFQILKAGDEESFLKFNGGKISEFVDALDGDCENNSSCTLLQYCFRRGLIAWHQEKRKYDNEPQIHYSDITANHIVKIFCQSGMAKCIQHLLNNGANIGRTIRKFNEPLLEVAIVRGYYPLVSMVLGRKECRFSPERICNIIIILLQDTNSDIDLNNTISVLLNRLLTLEYPLGNDEITTLMNVLMSGVRRLNRENIHLLLKFPGSLCTTRTDENGTEKTVLEEIDPEVIQIHLNECVEHRNEKIYLNYDSFIIENSTEHVIKNFLDSPVLNVFLNHLVFKTLINRKWQELHAFFNIKYFYLNLYFYIVFYILLNVYVLLKFNNASEWLIILFLSLGIICLMLFILKEIAQIIGNYKVYFREFNNYAEIVFIIVTIVTYTSETWPEMFMVLSVLTSNLVLLLMLEQVPKFAKYIIILRTVVFYLKYIIFYFIQFLAFAICFYILFSKSDQIFWNDLPNKVFETVILFTGNLDYMETNKFKKNELFAKLIFTLFVVFMAIILHNLLLGLLVTDMSDLSKNVKVFEQTKRAGFVVRLESFFDNKHLSYFSPKHNYQLTIFDEGDKYLIVNDNDRKILDDNEKQNLDFILVKNVKRQDVLKKLYAYIRTKINERNIEGATHELCKEVLEKLQMIEERLKILHDANELIKTEISKTNNIN